MSSFTADDIHKVANLAKIAVAETEIPVYSRNLTNILDLISQMEKIDTTNVEPMWHPTPSSLRCREDVITETNQRELFQTIAPQVEAGLYLVPQVVE